METRASFRRLWLLPMLSLVAVAVVIVTVLYGIDTHLTGGPGSGRPDGLGAYFFFDQDHITDAVAGLAAMVD